MTDTTINPALDSVTFVVRRHGCTAYAAGLSLSEALDARAEANRTMCPGHTVQVDDASGLPDYAVRAFLDEAGAAGDEEGRTVASAALHGSADGRWRVAECLMHAALAAM